MATVILGRGWAGQFRRTVRDKDGNVLKDEAGADRVLTFNPGEVRELSGDELEAVRDDIGKALHIAKTDEQSQPVAKPDAEATAKFVEETKNLRAQQLEARNDERRQEAERRAATTQAIQAAVGATTPPPKIPPPRRTGTRTEAPGIESKDR
jgi:hypothetical protein